MQGRIFVNHHSYTELQHDSHFKISNTEHGRRIESSVAKYIETNVGDTSIGEIEWENDNNDAAEADDDEEESKN